MERLGSIEEAIESWWQELGEPWRTLSLVLFMVLIFVVQAVRI